MIIYDPPTAEAPRSEWEAYVSNLDHRQDAKEIKRARAFMEKIFAPGFNLRKLLTDGDA